jgi:formate dehydrogenase major subunit
MVDSDCIVIMGSNMAECHPVAFRWPMQARLKGATLIHIDPRFTRTSANCDIHAPLRAGSDIAFLGGLINHVLNSDRWKNDPFFQTFVSTYTNATTIVSPDFKDTEDLEGIFSGLESYSESPDWPYNGLIGSYNPASWQYASSFASEKSARAGTLAPGQPRARDNATAAAAAPAPKH